MPGIVCAIRGGPDSQPTIDKAIILAGEVGLTVYFLYVVNLDFLSRTHSSRISTIQDEIHQMGEFILLTAKAKADEKSVPSEGVIRQGKVEDEIIRLCEELNANYIILGRPKGQQYEDVFASDRLEQFKLRLESESGAKVVLAERIDQ